MTQSLPLRLARPDDLALVDDLLGQSYPRLLQADYPPSVMVTVVPLIARARPELLASGRYFVIEGQGRLLAAGGYSLAAPGPRGGAEGAVAPGVAHIRHLATHPEATRQGLGRQLMAAILVAATEEGATRFDCLSTRTAVPFYRACGFEVICPVEIAIRPGLIFPAIRMQRDI